MIADPVGERLRLVHVVGGEEDGLAELAQAADHLPRLAPGRGVEAGRRLVEEEQLGIADQRQRDVEAALLAAGELEPSASSAFSVEADELDRLVDVARAAGSSRRTARPPRGPSARACSRHSWSTIPIRSRQLAVGARRDRRRARSTSPARAVAVALEDLDRGRLAGAVGAEEGEDLARA